MYYYKRILTLAVLLAVVKQNQSFKSGQKLLRPYVVFNGPFGKLQCIKECLLRRKCEIIGYNQRHLRCEMGEENLVLSDSDYMSVTAFRTDLIQYEHLLGQCANHTCIQRQVCVEYESTYRCIDDGCQLPWKQYKNHCYYFSTEFMTWDDANGECRKFSAFQIKVDDEAENDWIGVNNNPAIALWLGASDKKTEGKWIWELDASPVNLDLWSPNQPNNLNGEHCLMIDSANRWWDTSCKDSKKFICEKAAYPRW